jgi:ribosomal protein S18 acetylase RimI-like enzyme
VTDEPRAGAAAGTRLEPLTRARAEELADELLAMSADSDWDDWDRTNLLSDRPAKWDLSLLVTESGEPVAWAVVSRTPESLHLHHIVVSPARRSSGVGALLVRELIERVAPGRLTLKVHPDNVAAARFYERLGFTEGPASPSGYRSYAIDTPPPPRQTTEAHR